jgi:hypothetical protein
MSRFRRFVTGWRPSSGLVYLVTFLLFAGLLWHLQAMNQNDACQARNELRGQFLAVQDFDRGLADELKDYLVLRLSGDKSKIAEGVGSLRETVRDVDNLEVFPIVFEDC